jgi:hypothetical protein
LNKIELLTGRLEGADIIAPLMVMTAVVIRFLKTRAEIGGWNKPDFKRAKPVLKMPSAFP